MFSAQCSPPSWRCSSAEPSVLGGRAPATLTIWHFAFWLAGGAANRAGHLVSLTDEPHAAEHLWLRLFLVDANEAGVALVNASLGPPLISIPPSFMQSVRALCRTSAGSSTDDRVPE